jgi:hypothetical protein
VRVKSNSPPCREERDKGGAPGSITITATLDTYELLSKVAKIHLNEMVDPNYVVVASIEKKYLPAKRKP